MGIRVLRRHKDIKIVETHKISKIAIIPEERYEQMMAKYCTDREVDNQEARIKERLSNGNSFSIIRMFRIGQNISSESDLQRVKGAGI